MDKKKNSKDNKKILISSIALLALVVIMAGVAIYYMSKNQNKDDKTLAYTDLIKEMSYGNIEKILFSVFILTIIPNSL